MNWEPNCKILELSFLWRCQRSLTKSRRQWKKHLFRWHFTYYLYSKMLEDKIAIPPSFLCITSIKLSIYPWFSWMIVKITTKTKGSVVFHFRNSLWWENQEYSRRFKHCWSTGEFLLQMLLLIPEQMLHSFLIPVERQVRLKQMQTRNLCSTKYFEVLSSFSSVCIL